MTFARLPLGAPVSRRRASVAGPVTAAILAAGLLAGCTGSGPGTVTGRSRATAPGSYFQDAKIVNLQNGAFPSFLAFGSHGTLWLTENGGNVIARVDAAGAVKQYSIRAGNNNDPQDIVYGPGGNIWFTGLAEIGKIAPDGTMTVWNSIGSSTGLPDALAVGPGGQLWFTDDGGHLCHVSSSGTFGCYAIHPATKDIWMRGLALGSDGALWFTEDNLGSAADTQNAIGRLTPSGMYRQWLLPPGSGPTRIAAGPDGALWFTERDSQRIGRITTSGVITQFPLPRGVYPFDIVAGPGQALWFTTDTRVGRITTAGQITLWPVPEAEQFGGIAVSADGSLWLADSVASVIRHFVPPPVRAGT